MKNVPKEIKKFLQRNINIFDPPPMHHPPSASPFLFEKNVKNYPDIANSLLVMVMVRKKATN